MDTKQKYVRLDYNMIIIFPQEIEHSKFINMNPISAGFCYLHDNEVKCFGKSVSLRLESVKEDSYVATRQVYGVDY